MDISELNNEIKRIDRILRISQSRLIKLQPGRIRASQKGGGQYYIFSEEKKSWEYISKEDLSSVVSIAQYNYEKTIQKLLGKQKQVIDRFLQEYKPDAIIGIQEGMSKARLKMLNLYIEPTDEYVSRWKEKPYVSNRFSKEKGYLTQNGEIVRSKSEVIIADRLKYLGIPYKYEYPIKLDDGFVYPDFVLLDVPNRTEIIYEHFGMMDDCNYVNNSFLAKMERYARNGYFIGKNLIATFESQAHPLDVRGVHNALRTIFPKVPII